MTWYVNDSSKINTDWNDKLRQAGFFRTNYTHDALEYFLNQISEKPNDFKITDKLEDGLPQDVYLELAKAGLLSNTRKINLLKKLIEYEKERN